MGNQEAKPKQRPSQTFGNSRLPPNIRPQSQAETWPRTESASATSELPNKLTVNHNDKSKPDPPRLDTASTSLEASAFAPVTATNNRGGYSRSYYRGGRGRRGGTNSNQAQPLFSATRFSESPEIEVFSHAEKESNSTPTNTIDAAATMATEDIDAKLANVNLNDKKEINILLLGQTGAGKSTFINSIFNYLQFEDFKKAEGENLNVLIPANFTIANKDGKMENVEVGSKDDNNEDLTTGASATQGVKTYSFHIKGGNTLIRLIDTPGMVDTRGVEFDEQNCENILTYLNRLHHLHAICYVVKSQESRLTIPFIYCVSQILSRLEKSACKNIVFVFTHSKGSNYSPGETIRLLERIAVDIKNNPAHAEIPLQNNAFCFDNEAFMALAAIKNGIELSPEVRKWSITSWNKSASECWRLIEYILGLPPHMVHNTAAVNEARRVIYQLAQPMADIAQLVNDNIQILQNHRRHLDIDNRSLTELKQKLYIPVIELIVTPLKEPTTVCTDLQCSEMYNVGEKKEAHYKRCHDPCYLTNVPRDQLGSPELINCASMGPNQMCTKCSHSYKVHMHIYYKTEKKHAQQKDDIVSKNINTKELVIENARKVIAQVEQRKQLLERELNTIVKCNAKFAHFLSNNAIAAFNDSYAEYINYQMIRERRLGAEADMSKMAGLQRLLREHNEMKKIFKEAAEMQEKLGKSDEVTPQEISKTMQELFKLTLNGKKIREMFDSQKKSRSKEYTYSEYKHEGVFQQTPRSENKKKADDKKGQSSASNPTTKFQRGRPNNRGNYNNNQPRGRSAGPHQRNDQGRDRTPPPPYFQATGPPRYPPSQGPNYYPPDYRGQPAYPPHSDGGRPYYPPPHTPPATANVGGNAKPDNQPSIEVHVTLPPQAADQGAAGNPPPPRDYRYPDYHGHPPRDYRDYPPRHDYYARDHYPPYPRDPYGPRDPYYPRDPNYPRDPYGYPPPDAYPPPRDGYHPDPRYGGPGPSSYYPPPDTRGRPNHYQNNRGNPRGNNNNYRGNRGRGGVNRKYRKKQDGNNANNSGDESDTSVASSVK